jgi:hypothetical protein
LIKNIEKKQVAPVFFLFYNDTAMKDPEGIILFIVGVLVAGALFWGVTTAVRRSFSLHDIEITDPADMVEEQRRRSRGIMDSQKRLMEDQQQKIRDLQRR